jgi:hypothetical protein
MGSRRRDCWHLRGPLSNHYECTPAVKQAFVI